MRRLLAIALITLTAAVAHAAGPPNRITVVTQPVKRTTPAAPVRAAPGPSVGASAPLVSWTQPGIDGTACRQTCAQTRYFCDADPNADDCASAWGQCVAACGSPNLNAASAAAAGN